MSTQEVTYYVAKCDECERVADSDDYGGEFSAWADHGTAIEMLSDDWFTEGPVLCPDCRESMTCEVCGAKQCTWMSGHLVCDEHEDHTFARPEFDDGAAADRARDRLIDTQNGV